MNLHADEGSVIPVVFSGFDEVVNLAVHKLKDALFSALFRSGEFLGRSEDDRASCAGGRARLNQQLLQFLARGLEVIEVGQDLNDLARIL